MSGQVFQNLKLSTPFLIQDIDRLKSQRAELNNEMNIDRNDLNTVQNSMIELGRQLQSRQAFIREKQRKLMQIQKAINETEKSYEIIVQTTRKLSNALESQSHHLRSTFRH